MNAKRMSQPEVMQLLQLTEHEVGWLRRHGYLDVDAAGAFYEGQVRTLQPDLADLRARIAMPEEEPRRWAFVSSDPRRAVVTVVWLALLVWQLVFRALLPEDVTQTVMAVLSSTALIGVSLWLVLLLGRRPGKGR